MPSAQELFERFFLPLYPGGADLALVRSTDANPGNNPSILAELTCAAEVFAKLAPEAFGDPELALDFTDASVHRLGARLTKELRDSLIDTTVDGAPLLVPVVIHGAAYVGECVVRQHKGKWLVRNPLWESLVRLSSSAGVADLAVFQWWLKALSDEEVGHGRLIDRYRTHVEVPTFDPSSLPLIADASRKLPRLAKVRYDLLYKHLRAHLPELRTVGEDFPSPERFEQYGFASLDFHLLGGGRMLLISGPTKEGLHLFWLDASGFQKSAFFPADSFPAPMVKVEGDKLCALVSVGGKQETYEMLWWGA